MLTFDESIGRQIKEAREEERMSQAELGKRLGDYLGKEWPRQTVSQVEQGERPLKVVEIVAICQILPIAPITLLLPTAPVKLPSGRELDFSHSLVGGMDPEQAHGMLQYIREALDGRLGRLEEFLSLFDDQWDSMVEGLGKVLNAADEINRAHLDVTVGKEVHDE